MALRKERLEEAGTPVCVARAHVRPAVVETGRVVAVRATEVGVLLVGNDLYGLVVVGGVATEFSLHNHRPEGQGGVAAKGIASEGNVDFGTGVVEDEDLPRVAVREVHDLGRDEVRGGPDLEGEVGHVGGVVQGGVHQREGEAMQCAAEH